MFKDNQQPTLEDYMLNIDNKIIFHLLPYKKMFFYTQASKGEVSGFGRVKETEKGFVVTDIKTFEQSCTPGHTKLDGEALTIFYLSLEHPEEYRLWWHTHNDFSAYFSPEDKGTIAELSEDALLISVCMNKDGDIVARADMNGETKKLSVVIIPTGNWKLKGECYKEIQRKVMYE